MDRIGELVSDALASSESPCEDADSTSRSTALQNSNHQNTKTISSDSIRSLWRQVEARLEKHINPQIFAAWIKPLTISDFLLENGILRLSLAAPNKFSAQHIQRHYLEIIRAVFSEVSTIVLEIQQIEVLVVVASCAENTEKKQQIKSVPIDSLRKQPSAPARRTPTSTASSARPVASQAPIESNLITNYNFSNFVVGGCNQFAHAVSLQVAENLGSTYNPLFIYGGVGLGKTHLANAIGNASRRRNKKVLLVSSETFVSELISSLRSNSMERFKSKFRSLDLLIIDDIQFIIGKERTQEEFFHTFNELYNRNKQIIVTSDKVPQELIGLEDRLRTRFTCGVSADLQAPDFETRVAILIKKAQTRNISLSDNVAKLIAERIDTNVRELEGALNRLIAMASLKQVDPTTQLAEEILQTISPTRRIEVTTDRIQKVVAERFNVSIGDLLGKRRTHNIAFARQVAMYLCREHTGCSYPELGALFGGRDHSTVIHARKVISEKIQSDDDFRNDLSQLEQSLHR